MKLKAIFLLFNSVLVVSFLLIFLMPLFLLGTDSFSLFWGRNWIIAAVFLATLGAVNAYFGVNWRLFVSLEKEDWPALVVLLEDRVLRRGLTRPMYVRLLLNAYLILSNTEGILALEAFLRQKSSRLVERYSVQFGIPYLLMKDPAVSEAFFSSLLASKRLSGRDWVRWNRCFSLLQMARGEAAREELRALSASAREPLVRLLSLYLLDVLSRNDPEAAKLVAEGRNALRSAYTPYGMQRAIERSGENMEVVILSKIVGDAQAWLYGDGSRPARAPAAALEQELEGPRGDGSPEGQLPH